MILMMALISMGENDIYFTAQVQNYIYYGKEDASLSVSDSVISHKTDVFITAAVGTSNPTKIILCHFTHTNISCSFLTYLYKKHAFVLLLKST
jgi:hypothetical protein